MATEQVASTRTDENPGLAQNSIGLPGVVGQSLSAMGLSGVIATSVPVVALTVGNGAWLVWGIATVVILLVTASIASLARRMATTGGLYGLATVTLGPLGALLCGWLMVALIGVGGVGAVLSFGSYFGGFLQTVGLDYNKWVLMLSSLALLVLCWWLSRIGARPAAWIMFLTEIVTTLAILILLVIVLFQNPGGMLDKQQLSLEGVSITAVITAVVLGVSGFGGFESATVYGREAKNPRRLIPFAMIASVVIAGVVWMFASYVLFMGFGDSQQALSQAPAPVSTLAGNVGLDWYEAVIDLAISFTIGAAVIAGFSWVARMMMTMSRERVAPRNWSRVSPRYHTPSWAIAVVFVVWAALTIVMSLISDNPLDTFGEYIGMLSGLPALLVYALVSFAAVVFQWKEGRKFTALTISGVLGALAMLYTLYANLDPWPPYPVSLVVIAFLAVTVLIILGYLWLRVKRPQILAGIGESVRADTAADTSSSEPDPAYQGMD